MQPTKRILKEINNNSVRQYRRGKSKNGKQIL